MEKTNKFSNLIEYIEKCNNNFKQKIILNDTWDKLINRFIRIFEIKNFSEFAFWIIQTILLFFLFSSFFCKIENWSIRSIWIGSWIFLFTNFLILTINLIFPKTNDTLSQIYANDMHSVNIFVRTFRSILEIKINAKVDIQK